MSTIRIPETADHPTTPAPRYYVQHRPDLRGKPCEYNHRCWGDFVVIDGWAGIVHSGWATREGARVTCLLAERGQLIREEMP